jgi:hypothetical protein
MFYVQNKTTGQPAYMGMRGKIEKVYSMRILAEVDAKKAEKAELINPQRIDVVEISKSAKLWLENQARMQGES